MSHGLPEVKVDLTAETRSFWAGIAAGRIDMSWCEACDGQVWPPRSHCPRCYAVVTGSKQLSGEGEVYSFSVVHRGEGPFADVPPYVVAYVSLDGGPTVMANVVDVDPAEVSVGMRVRLVSKADEPGAVGILFAPTGA